MKTWKRLFGCLLAGTMLLSLAACGGNDSPADDQAAAQLQEETAPPADTAGNTAAPEASAGENTADSGSVLVVYESLRDVELTTTEVENWDSYDTVFIGYPIWWGIAAWPVDGFVEANDFTGKTVIPFCTSSSSGLGQSGELLAELAGTGDWQDGERFRSSASQEDVNEWVDSLGLSAE